MKQIVADSSSLILLSKCSLLEITCTLFKVIIPLSVKNETSSQDLADKYPDAAIIRDLISRGVIKIVNPGQHRPQLPLSLHRGEEDALLLALSGDSLFATDDGKAIKAARFFKIPFIITPRIIVDLFKLEKIPLEKARQSIEKLGKMGRYSPEIIAESILSLMEAKNGKAHNNKDS